MRSVARDFRPAAPVLAVLGALVLLLLWAAGGPVAAHAQRADLLVETNVADATVLVDGEQVARTNEDGEALVSALRPGQHTVEVRRPGYWAASTRATLEPDLTTRVSLSLMPRPGEGSNLLVETNVADAIVEIDGEQVGQTGPDGRVYATGLAPGAHRVVVRKQDHAPARRTVTFDETGLDRTIQLRLLPAAPAVADTAAAPTDTSGERADSAVLAAGRGPSADTTAPDTALRPPVGRPPDTTDGRAAPRLLVDADVAGAQVAVGDSVYGQTGPDGRLAVQPPAGTHRVTVRKEGYQTVRTAARLAAGEEQVVSFDLSRTPTVSTDPLGTMSDNLLLIFLVSLAGLTGIVAAIFGIAGWKQGVFTRWFRGGERFDRYDLLEVLRRSEFTTVYLASDPPEHRRLALAVLDDPYAGRPDHAQKFLQRGRALEEIWETDPDAPVLDVYRAGRANDAETGRPFIAHERLEGDTLLRHLEAEGRLDTAAALGTIRQVCAGLRALHEAGGRHGAVTPENLIVTQTDPVLRIKLVGFRVRIIGFDMKERSMPLLGGSTGRSTAAYVAPEQFRNGKGDPRSDMYAAGMLFYKLVTGAPPYAGDDPARVIERLEQEPPPDLPDHIPDHVTAVFYRMISPDPDRRPTAARVVSVLDLIQTTA